MTMSNNNAHTPKNRWGITIPAATYGAEQLPVPQPATMGEVETEAYREKLKTAMWAQIEANAQAKKDRAAREGAKPYRATSTGGRGVGAAVDRAPTASASAASASSVRPISPPAIAPLVRGPDRPADAGGAEAARSLAAKSDRAPPAAAAGSTAGLSDQEYDRGRTAALALVSGEGLASSASGARPAAPQAAMRGWEEQEAAGAVAVVALIGTPEKQRANRAAQSVAIGAGGSDAAAGAAEARRLLGQN